MNAHADPYTATTPHTRWPGRFGPPPGLLYWSGMSVAGMEYQPDYDHDGKPKPIPAYVRGPNGANGKRKCSPQPAVSRPRKVGGRKLPRAWCSLALDAKARLGLTFESLSLRLGRSRSSVNNWVRKGVGVTPAEAQALAQALGIEPPVWEEAS